MLSRTIVAFLVFVAFTATAVVAQIAIPDEPHTWLTTGEDRAQLVAYPNAGCDPECATARIVCTDFGRFDISVYNFTRNDILEWVTAEDGPFTGLGEQIRVVFRADGMPNSFIVWNLAMNDFNGTWIAETFARRQADAAWLEGFAMAADIVIDTPTRTIAWPNRPEDRANRAAFVEACLAM